MIREDRLLLFQGVAVSLLVHLFSLTLLWKVQMAPRGVDDPSPLMVRLLPASEIPRFIDQPDAPPTEEPVKSKDISQVRTKARGPGKLPGPVATPESSGTPKLPQSLPEPVSVPASPPARPEEAKTPAAPPPKPPAEPEVSPQPAPSSIAKPPDVQEKVVEENKVVITPRTSFREQIAALGRRELFGDADVFDAGRIGETGTDERTVSLETQSSEYAPYLAGVKRRIQRHWYIHPYVKQVGLTGKLVLFFSIDRDGELARLEISQSSGVSILDEAAVEAVKAAAPYSPFPPMFNFRRLNIIANFQYVARAPRPEGPAARQPQR
ncbi:MAG: TonB family protein [Candidatus Methylomirabilales bacterium]